MSFKYAFVVVLLSLCTHGFTQTVARHSAQPQQYNNAYLVKVSPSFDACSFENNGFAVGSQIGQIQTVYTDACSENMLRALPGVISVQPAKKLNPQMNRAIPDMRVDSVYQGYKLKSGYTGKGVLIGITDWGFDYSHPNFYDTSLQQTRIVAAWDQFKKSGPAPASFDYGTEYNTANDILQAESDTAGLYDYAYHGSHVAGIAGGSGAGTNYRGVAYESNFLMVSLRLDEAGALDAFAWMKAKADELDMPLVVNMSWGLYHIGSMDGTGLLSEAIDAYSNLGVIFVTSAGNNGGETFHIQKDFSNDTLHTGIGFDSYTNPLLWGQSISVWGEPDEMFNVELLILNNNNDVVYTTPTYTTRNQIGYVDTFVIVNTDTVFYNLSASNSYEFNNRPTMRLRVRERSSNLKVALRSFAPNGTVHYWNVVELTNDAGNWGGRFEDWLPGWEKGNDAYSLGDPASTKSVIAVAAHTSEVRLQNGNVVGGRQANFTSKGPTLDGRRKPDISAPGVSVASSVSSFTTQNYTLLESVNFNGKEYPFTRISGTSMASPAVAGVVALMLEANPGLSYIDVKRILQLSARLDANTGVIGDTSDLSWGWGKVNASVAVRIAESWVPTIIVPVVESNEIYPNPTTQTLYVQKDSAVECSIFSMDGKKVVTGDIDGLTGLDVSHLVAGTYVVTFADSSIKPQKIIIIR